MSDVQENTSIKLMELMKAIRDLGIEFNKEIEAL